MKSVRNHADFLVAGISTTSLTNGVHYTSVNFNDGTLFMTDEKGNIITTSANTINKFRIGVYLGEGNFKFSEIFNTSDVKYISGQDVILPTNEVYTVTPGNTIVPNTYSIVLRFTHGSAIQQADQYIITTAMTVDSSYTNKTFCESFVTLLNKNFGEIPQTKFFGITAVKAYLTNTTNDFSVQTSGGNVTFTKGSNLVTFVESSSGAGNAGKYNEDNNLIITGDYIASTYSYGVMYKIVGFNVNTPDMKVAILDRPWEFNTVQASKQNVMVYNTNVTNNFGFAIIGYEGYYSYGKFPFEMITFDINSINFPSESITKVQSGNIGSGFYKQVKDMEYQFNAANGNWYKASPYNFQDKSYVNNSYTYSFVVISAETMTQHAIGHKDYSLKEVYIAIPKGNNSAAVTTLTAIQTMASSKGISLVPSNITLSNLV
ncbi:MAG: hypothetical protein HPY57_12900 [Ignavibacteria bacterium]|nr:hypothetical protein [Ignavibacteria bacterium]